MPLPPFLHGNIPNLVAHGCSGTSPVRTTADAADEVIDGDHKSIGQSSSIRDDRNAGEPVPDQDCWILDHGRYSVSNETEIRVVDILSDDEDVIEHEEAFVENAPKSSPATRCPADDGGFEICSAECLPFIRASLEGADDNESSKRFNGVAALQQKATMLLAAGQVGSYNSPILFEWFDLAEELMDPDGDEVLKKELQAASELAQNSVKCGIESIHAAEEVRDGLSVLGSEGTSIITDCDGEERITSSSAASDESEQFAAVGLRRTSGTADESHGSLESDAGHVDKAVAKCEGYDGLLEQLALMLEMVESTFSTPPGLMSSVHVTLGELGPNESVTLGLMKEVLVKHAAGLRQGLELLLLIGQFYDVLQTRYPEAVRKTLTCTRQQYLEGLRLKGEKNLIDVNLVLSYLVDLENFGRG